MFRVVLSSSNNSGRTAHKPAVKQTVVEFNALAPLMIAATLAAVGVGVQSISARVAEVVSEIDMTGTRVLRAVRNVVVVILMGHKIHQSTPHSACVLGASKTREEANSMGPRKKKERKDKRIEMIPDGFHSFINGPPSAA